MPDPLQTPTQPPILDDSRGRLGCGTGGAFITGQCGFPTVCVLSGIKNLHWTRALDDVSEAEIIIGLGGDENSPCCECMRDIEPWCHELHITRNGIEEWCGPITQVIYSFNQIRITAVDMAGWLDVKIPALDTDYTAVDTDLTTIAFGNSDSILNVALSETNECILDDVQAYPNSIAGKRKFIAFGATSLEYLNDLSQSGLNYTTLGRSIILSGEIDQLVPLAILRDEHILGEIEVLKDGLQAGNRWYVHYAENEGIPAVYSTSDPDTYCYGRVERMRTEDTLQTAVDAQVVGGLYAEASKIAPRMIEVPEGSKLSPETPWTLQQMVCGTRVDVQLSKLCFPVEQSFILNRVEVDEDSESGEEIKISLTPINAVGI
jgi:hypothetical protein